jgi:hypothetical protein
MRRGGVVRLYDACLAHGSRYKSLLVSEKSDCLHVIALALACNNINDANPSQYFLLQVLLLPAAGTATSCYRYCHFLLQALPSAAALRDDAPSRNFK